MKAYARLMFVATSFGLFCTSAIAQVPGQPYYVPAGYQGYPAGTLISYGGFNYVIQADGTMLLAQQTPPPPPPMPGYPYYNPVVGGGSYISPGQFNPYTGTWNYDTGTTTVYSSAYQGMTTPVAPGSMRQVFQPNPFGGFQTGRVWRDIYGLPHGDVSNTMPNGIGGTNTVRQLYGVAAPRR